MPRPPTGLTPDDCPFCDIHAERIDNGVIAYRSQSALAFPSKRQRDANRGHMLVVPATHIRDVYELAEPNSTDLLGAVSVVARATRAAFGADGITIMQHNEYAGGQDVFHLHVHVVPRFDDDGFYHGDGRFPHGMREIPLPERLSQAAAVRRILA